jgi:hypothetical protein
VLAREWHFALDPVHRSRGTMYHFRGRHRLYAPVFIAEALTGYVPNEDAGTVVHVEGCVITSRATVAI